MANNEFLIYNTISNISKLVLFINVILYFKSYRKNSIAFKVFTNYLLFILIIQLITSYMRWYKLNNLYFSHFYFVGQFIFLSLFYLFLEKKNVFKKGIKTILFLVLILIGIYYVIYPKDFFIYNTLEIITTSIPLIVYSFYFFIKKIDSENKKFIYLNSGFFLYISCSTLLFVTGNIENSSLKMIVWYSNVSLYLVYQVLVFVEWYKNFKKPLF
jgi:hypothetical protein